MSYWGNTYMPTIDALAIETARSYVRQIGSDLGHKWPYGSEGYGTDEQAFRYIVNCIAEACEDYAESPDWYECNYEKCVFDALVFGINTLMEQDWSTYDHCEWVVTLAA